MTLEGLHLLLTYQCTYECDHCFVWAGPRQTITMNLDQIQKIVHQAADVQSVRWIYFEGGEPFLYHAVLLQAVRKVVEMGLRVGVVTNGYWATEVNDALEWLKPFRGLLDDFSVSCDSLHGDATAAQRARNAYQAACALELPSELITIQSPSSQKQPAWLASVSSGEYPVRYRGRAVQQLAAAAPKRPWPAFDSCPHEDLRDPDRVHVDPFGHIHLCQGLVLGNLFQHPLERLIEGYDPDSFPVIGTLLHGGPAELMREFDLPCHRGYADACHLCYEARLRLRSRFPEVLTPDQVYGVDSAEERQAPIDTLSD